MNRTDEEKPAEIRESWVGRTLELEVGAVAHGGHCVARSDNRVIFVRHALPGERVTAQVTEDKGGSFCRADAVAVLEASPQRVEPSCAVAGPGLCGGCDWQHAAPELQRELSDDESLQVLQRERKKRVEAMEAFDRAGREEQADREEFELDVIEEFMPDPLSEEELEEIVDDVIAEVGATSIRDLGRVMADVMPQVSGRADGSTVSQLVREKLA